ncbi:lanthionine synthetase C family protein [Paenibacillus sp. SI8]|uniref:lanthionine synthetase C family protein n=1 Tax=unclassified Paenibacillus TaxID=185978 RepID=UPI003467A6FC
MNTEYCIDRHWKSVSPQARTKIIPVIMNIAERYKDPEHVRTLMLQEHQEELDGKHISSWEDLNLAMGFSGICLLLGQMDRLYPEGGWDYVGHRYLQLIQKTLEEKGVYSMSVWSGLSGILVAIRSLSRNGTRYQTMTDTLTNLMADSLQVTFDQMRGRWLDDLQMSQYDVMEGLAGIGRAVLLFPDNARMKSVWQEIAEFFHQMSGTIDLNGQKVPAWYVSSKNQFLSHEKVIYPNGNFNVGMSHGITGPLSFLSLSKLHGMEYPSMEEDIRRLADWVCEWKSTDSYGLIWPKRLPYEVWASGSLDANSVGENQESWCYGTPGVARSLWLAGKAVQNDTYAQVAVDGYLGISNRPREKWGLYSGTFCHGLSGLLHTVQRMYSDTGVDEFGNLRDRLVDEVLKLYEPDSMFGYYDYDQSKGYLRKTNQAGLLNGAAGTALVLASLLGNEEPDWDAVFLIR